MIRNALRCSSSMSRAINRIVSKRSQQIKRQGGPGINRSLVKSKGEKTDVWYIYIYIPPGGGVMPED